MGVLRGFVALARVGFAAASSGGCVGAVIEMRVLDVGRCARYVWSLDELLSFSLRSSTVVCFVLVGNACSAARLSCSAFLAVR